MRNLIIQIKTEIKLHLREPEAIFWGFIFPVIMIIVLGFIFSKKDQYQGKIQAGMTTNFQMSKYKSILENDLNYNFELIADTQIEPKIKNEDYLFVFDTDSNNSITMYHATFSQVQFREEYSKLLEYFHSSNTELLQKMLPYRIANKEVKIETDSGKEVNYVSWLIPGVIALNIFLSCIFGIGISIVQDKQKGKLKKIATTPLPKLNFILALSVQRMMVLFLQVIVICIAGFLIFDVTIKGAFFDLFIVLFLSMLSFMIFGFAIASVSNTIEKAVALSNLFFLLAIVISGAYFPNTGLPIFLKFIADLLPITMAVDAARGVFAYGDSLSFLYDKIIGLLLWIIFSLCISLKLFKWHSD